MSTTLLIIIIGAFASLFASAFTLAAAMLSSRISQSENIIETYDDIQAPIPPLSEAYSLEH
ncbi:MAG: hypothetical protein ACE5EY_04645 [Anaerolineae bacterium]